MMTTRAMATTTVGGAMVLTTATTKTATTTMAMQTETITMGMVPTMATVKATTTRTRQMQEDDEESRPEQT